MNHPRFLLPLLLGGALAAQTTTIFPDEYVAVPEGPGNSPNLPLASGTSRVQVLYEGVDLAIPSGHQITKLGFRQDGALTQLDTGRGLQLEIRMGYSSEDSATMGSNFANNYATTPVTVFGPALYTLPDLRDTANPLPNGQFFINLTTPFTYNPSLGNLVVDYWIYGNSGGGTPFNYRLDRADYYSPVTYGPVGCPGSNGTPNLTVDPTRPGLFYSTRLSSAPGSSFAVLVIVPGGQLQTPVSLQSLLPGVQASCTGQVNLAGALSLTGVTGSTGVKSWSFAIPNNPSFNDFDWASQALIFDFFAPGGAVVSNGAHVLTGVRPRTAIVSASGPPQLATTGSVQRNYCPVPFFVHQ
ncbi:MAG: hypothetical protein KDE27_07395 [Planctomycetes bacterium]|nr:hypothetical protein [Planctomycetota bacterium]